jgi:hypothetical protein
VNIREVIEKLQEIAQRLPGGLDSEVHVAICNANETLLRPAAAAIPSATTTAAATVATMVSRW